MKRLLVLLLFVQVFVLPAKAMNGIDAQDLIELNIL